MTVVGAARALLVDMMLEPAGRPSPSVYETGRLVAIAPWLVGHAARLRYLLGTQRSDGGWGGPDGYALVPTLSAVDALLVALHGPRTGIDQARLAGAADRGLRFLLEKRWGRGTLSIPDTPAVDLIVPALTVSINDRLASEPGEPSEPSEPGTPLDHWRGRCVALPAGMDGRRLAAVRSSLTAGAPVPEKLLHALEVAADLTAGASGIRPSGVGAVGASPAATAAWLGTAPAPDHPARRYLEATVRRHRGPVPCATPIGLFERAWVLAWLGQAGVPLAAPRGLRASLAAAAAPGGAPAGPGLPCDADTTSVALYALALLGAPHEPRSLWTFEMDTHFCTWQGEDGESVTVNAHVLEAFGQYTRALRCTQARYAGAVYKLSRWLCDRQRPEGWWSDRWHASTYYATACCALALDRFGADRGAAAAVRRAVDWVLATQKRDGSWGVGDGTVEETAYALRIVMTRLDETVDHAISAGYRYLLDAIRGRPRYALADPPLWHDKDLYSPATIVFAAVVSALYQAQRRLAGAVTGPANRAPSPM